MVWDAEIRYRLLLEINNAIVTHTSRVDLFNQLAGEIRKIVSYDRFSINLYDQKKKLLSYFSTAKGISPKAISGDERPLEKGAIARAAIRSREPVIITQRGRAAAVLLSVEEYERTENERQILLLLARGEKEIAQGVGHTLDDVLADADRLLAGSD